MWQENLAPPMLNASVAAWSSFLKLGDLAETPALRGGLASKLGELQLEGVAENQCGMLRRGRCRRAAGDVLKSVALPGPEHARLMRKAGEIERKKGQIGGTTRREKKRAMADRNGPLAGGKQQRG